MLKIKKGDIYKIKIFREGNGKKGHWALCSIVDAKGRNPITCWLKNTDHGITDDTDFVILEDYETWSVGAEYYPKGSGNWRTVVSINDAVLKATSGEVNDFGSGKFTTEDFTTKDDLDGEVDDFGSGKFTTEDFTTKDDLDGELPF